MDNLFTEEDVQKKLFDEWKTLGLRVSIISAMVQNDLSNVPEEHIVKMRDQLSASAEEVREKLNSLEETTYKLMSDILSKKG